METFLNSQQCLHKYLYTGRFNSQQYLRKYLYTGRFSHAPIHAEMKCFFSGKCKTIIVLCWKIKEMVVVELVMGYRLFLFKNDNISSIDKKSLLSASCHIIQSNVENSE